MPRERVIVAADAMHELHRPSRAAWHQSIVIVDRLTSVGSRDRVAADDQQQQFVSAVSSLFRNHHGHRHRVVPRERVIVAADAMHELHRPSRAAWHLTTELLAGEHITSTIN